MKTIDFRQFLADELQDPEIRREFIVACYEQDGVDGLLTAFDEISRADEHQGLKLHEPVEKVSHAVTDLRALLNRAGLELSVTRLPTPDNVLTAA